MSTREAGPRDFFRKNGLGGDFSWPQKGRFCLLMDRGRERVDESHRPTRPTPGRSRGTTARQAPGRTRYGASRRLWRGLHLPRRSARVGSP